MSDRPDDMPPQEDSIEPGKRLVHLRGNGGTSLGERLTNYFYRLTWRTPIHTGRLKGRYPLKLLVVPQDPITGSRERGEAILDSVLVRYSHFCATEKCDFGKSTLSPLFRDYLQNFDWLRDLAATQEKLAARETAEKLMRLWLDQYGEKVVDIAWRGDVWGARILNWAAHARLILASSDIVYRSAVLNALARGARHLDRVADRVPSGVARVKAWAGIVAAGLLMPGGEPRRVAGEAGLARALGDAMSDDGGTTCRSPYALMDLIGQLSMLKSVYAARKLDCPAFLEERLAKAVPALLAVTLGDGGLGSWQGGAAIPAEDLEAIIAASGVRARPLRQPREWGFQRMSAGATQIVMDAAPPPDRRLAFFGSASTLAFEMSDGTERIIVNCGGARHVGDSIPAALAVGLRTTAAHSTLVLADSNSTAVHNDGQLGKGVEQVELDRQEIEQGSRIVGAHDGYAKRFGLTHRRALVLSADGREVRCDDILLPAKSRRKSTTNAFAVRFHLGARVEVTPTADGQGALLRSESGIMWQFKAQGGTVSVDDSLWVDGDGAITNTQQLVVSGDAPPGGASISWLLKKAS